MNRLAIPLLLALSATAQTNPQELIRTPEVVRKVVDVKHLSGERAERAMNLLKAYMHPVGSVHFDQSLRSAVLIGPEKIVAGAEALLAKFDAPGAVRPDRQIQLRIHLVEGAPDGESGPMPVEIAPAVEQMKKSFAYKVYRHLDTLSAIGKDGVTSSGALAFPGPGRTRYTLRVQSSAVMEDGKTVALKNFAFVMHVPQENNTFTTETSIQTDLTIQQGQKLVVGKLASGTPRNAMFLIVTVDVQ